MGFAIVLNLSLSTPEQILSTSVHFIGLEFAYF